MVIHVNETQLIVNFLIAVVVSIFIALIFRLPLLPEKPIRFSFNKSAVFPTPVFAMGFLAICFSLNFYWIYDGMALAVLCAIAAVLFIKFGFDYVFPEPDLKNKENNEEEVH